MTRPLKFALVILSALFAVIVAALFIVLPIVSTPSFKVHNASYQPVEVIAYWRDQSRALGLLKPGKIIRFRLNDEAAMKFMVRFSNGTEKTSDEVYFTTGIRVYLTINDNELIIDSEL